jgi:hypothetical protein
VWSLDVKILTEGKTKHSERNFFQCHIVPLYLLKLLLTVHHGINTESNHIPDEERVILLDLSTLFY